jgi:Flp pilus assembly secretin CpaC
MKRFLRKTFGIATLLLMGANVAVRLAFAQNGQAASSPNVVNPKSATNLERLPPQILAVADYSAQMRIMHHCNRLITTRGNVARTFVADPRIAEVVQFRPNELVLIGLETGRTTVTLWFEDLPEPLIYLVEVVHEPVTPVRVVSQNGRTDETPQVTAYANRRRHESRGTARDRPVAPVKAAGANANSSALDVSLRRQPVSIPFGGRYDGHAPWPKADPKASNGATPIGFDGVLAGRVKATR